MSIDVQVRVRPEVPQNVWSTAETVLYSTLQPNNRYVFNKVHSTNATNGSVFRGIEPLLHAAFGGKHLTVLAYGQTGSGKTHSMLGTEEDAGIVTRSVQTLLQLVHTHPGSSLAVSFVEIYNETVRDLLDPQRGNGDLVLQDAPDGTVRYDKKTVDFDKIEDFLALQKVVERQRQYGVTDLNAHSSRSHLLLTIEIKRALFPPTEFENEEDGLENDKLRRQQITSVVHLVDLAGSECASRANTGGQTLREGGFINKSLLALGNVVDAIVERRSHIPYRDAKLTRLLRSCFGGSGLTFILCCVHPGRDNVEQTTASLRFTQRAMKLKGDPVVVLPLPPLFTHQYAKAAQALLVSAAHNGAAAYERGLRDCFLYCDGTLSNIVTTMQSNIADTLHALSGMQRLLLAHDHAVAIDQVGRLYEQVHKVTLQAEDERRQYASVKETLAQVLSSVAAKQAQLEALRKEDRVRRRDKDLELADWEHKLHEMKQKRVSPEALLYLEETEARAKVWFEWSVCMERITHQFIPALARALCDGEFFNPQVSTAADDGNEEASNTTTIPSSKGKESLEGCEAVERPPMWQQLSALPPNWRTDTSWQSDWQEQLTRERRVVLDLEAAREMVHEDSLKVVQRDEEMTTAREEEKEKREDGGEESRGGDLARGRSWDRSRSCTQASQTSPSREKPPLLYDDYPTLEALDERIEALELEEKRLQRQLHYRSHRYSIRRLQDALLVTPSSIHHSHTTGSSIYRGSRDVDDDDDDDENDDHEYRNPMSRAADLNEADLMATVAPRSFSAHMDQQRREQQEELRQKLARRRQRRRRRYLSSLSQSPPTPSSGMTRSTVPVDHVTSTAFTGMPAASPSPSHSNTPTHHQSAVPSSGVRLGGAQTLLHHTPHRPPIPTGALLTAEVTSGGVGASKRVSSPSPLPISHPLRREAERAKSEKERGVRGRGGSTPHRETGSHKHRKGSVTTPSSADGLTGLLQTRRRHRSDSQRQTSQALAHRRSPQASSQSEASFSGDLLSTVSARRAGADYTGGVVENALKLVHDLKASLLSPSPILGTTAGLSTASMSSGVRSPPRSPIKRRRRFTQEEGSADVVNDSGVRCLDLSSVTPPRTGRENRPSGPVNHHGSVALGNEWRIENSRSPYCGREQRKIVSHALLEKDVGEERGGCITGAPAAGAWNTKRRSGTPLNPKGNTTATGLRSRLANVEEPSS